MSPILPDVRKRYSWERNLEGSSNVYFCLPENELRVAAINKKENHAQEAI